MASLGSLPADQRAVVQLVLQQRRSYDEIAALLSIDRAGVRQRALDAFDSLGPGNSIPAEQRALLTDYLLGQLPERLADRVHDSIADSAAERAWLRVVASEVTPLTRDALPEIPGTGAGRRSSRAVAPPAAAAVAGGDAAAASRRGGAIVLGLAALVIVVVVVVLLVAGGGGKSKSPRLASASTSTSTTAATSTSTTSTTKAKVLGQVNLNSPNGNKTIKGIAQVISEGSTLGVLVVATHVPANTTHNAYAVWLYNSSSDAKLVGFVSTRVGSNGHLTTEGPLPSDASHYKEMLVTLETQQSPKSPGPVLLEGPLKIS
jgi:hypothetical protein